MRTSTAAMGSSVFLALAPGTVAGLVPWLLTKWNTNSWWLPARALGAVLVVAGGAVLLHSFAKFVFEGRGTPAPVGMPERLVVGGMYRHVRNPMYIALVVAVIGQALLLGRPVLLGYSVVVAALMWVFATFHEAPLLIEQYGEEYERYRSAVPGWVPRLRPWHG
ncbi:isoprenylcysteine carboxylmethyltransferase family protein [Actinomadura syzygii]|uniref:Isoprenylcysteine carboxylmethyltransferase family protein n=2 Tax=Actinomadura syzygii TaxID=1427538 RepID=A0A5D0U955_9ACTN|nr:isoprenylcysteine carboxylmethyltransferase family protein [Actinomadura syzygii]